MIAPVPCLQTLNRREVGVDEVRNVAVIMHAGAVGGGVVATKDLGAFAMGCGPRQARAQVGLGDVSLTTPNEAPPTLKYRSETPRIAPHRAFHLSICSTIRLLAP